MSKQDESAFDPIRVRIMQFLDAGLMRCDDTGQPAIHIALGHLGDVEPSLMLSVWDSRRLMCRLAQAISTYGDPLGRRLFEVLAEDESLTHGWREWGDPAVDPWPAPPKQPPKKKPRKRK